MNKQKIKEQIYHLPPFIVVWIKFCYRKFVFVYLFGSNKEYRSDILRSIKLRERKICFGRENKDKYFYVIRRASKYSEGHFSMLNFFLGHLKIAEERGLVPVIDMKNYYNNLWQAESNRCKENAWEYFYKQPASYSLDDIRSSRNIILCDGIKDLILPSHKFSYQKDEIHLWNKIYIKYILLNDNSNRYLTQTLHKLKIEERRVLAVSLRRGIEWGQILNYKYFAGYSKHPFIDETILKVEECMNDWNCDYVFLSIDDQEGLEEFKNVFKEKLLYIERDRWAYFKDSIAIPVEEIRKNATQKNDVEIYENELGFLTEVHILSKCNCIVCSKTSANASAFLINGNRYEHTYIF